jgi:two-component system response regulator NreC
MKLHVTDIPVVVTSELPLIRQSLSVYLAQNAEMKLVSPVDTRGLEQALSQDPAVLLFHVGSNDPQSVDFIEGILKNYSAVRVVVLADHLYFESFPRIFAMPVSSYVAIEGDPPELVRAVQQAARGHRCIDPALADLVLKLLGQDPMAILNHLSAREKEVVELVARGYSGSQAAAKLGISVKSVETYRSRISEKLGLRGRIELVSYALSHGMIQSRRNSKSESKQSESKQG